MSPKLQEVFSKTGAEEPFATFLKEPSNLTVEELFQRVSGAYNQGYLDGAASLNEVINAYIKELTGFGHHLKYSIDEFTAELKAINESN